MKQGIALILALLALSLYLQPCMDASLVEAADAEVSCTSHCEAENAADASCPSPDSEDPCDPGCVCQCCAPLLLLSGTTSLAPLIAIPPSVSDFYSHHFPRGFSENIWDPPRLS